MPIIACIVISAIVYFLLINYFQPSGEQERNNNDVFCETCNKEIQSNWRYCPYCGNIRGKR